MTTLVLTYEQRQVLADRYGLSDPNSLTADAIANGEREFAERRHERDVERQWLDMLGVGEPEEREYHDDLPESERFWLAYAAGLNIKNP